VRVAACQPKEIIADVDTAVRVVLDFAGQADTEHVDLLVLPEGFLQGYLVTEHHVRGHALEVGGAPLGTVLAQLAGIRQTLVLGMIERSGGTYFNTALVITGGRVAGRYRKTFLTGGESIFTPGDSYPIFQLDGMRPFGINICYDCQFPDAAAAVAAGGGRLLLTPAHNMMPREKALLWQHRHNEIRAQRARETGMWIVAADVTGQRGDSRIGLGPTCVMNPAGEVVAQVPTGTVGMVIAEIN
jgi:predicted amidohydrolase